MFTNVNKKSNELGHCWGWKIDEKIVGHIGKVGLPLSLLFESSSHLILLDAQKNPQDQGGDGILQWK